MKSVTSIVGIVLILAAGVLAAVSTGHQDVIKANKELCAKYTKDAKAALAQKDFNKAWKFAKLAIKVDPENKLGYNVIKEIADAQCSGKVPATATQKASAPASAKQPATPAKPAPAAEEEMGC